MIFLRILIFLIAIVLGIFILKYKERIVNTIGHSDWADRYLGGGGGTYNLWTIIGLLIIIAGIYILVRGW